MSTTTLTTTTFASETQAKADAWVAIPALSGDLFRTAANHCHHGDETDAYREEYQERAAALVTAGAGHLSQADLDRWSAAYATWLAARGRCSSAFVTGPAGRDVHRENKRKATARTKEDALRELGEKLLRGAARRQKAAATEAAGGEAAQVQTEIDEALKLHARMVAANRQVRRKPKNESTPEKLAALVELGISDVEADSLFVRAVPACCYGYPGFQLTSQLSRVKRLSEKLVTLASRDDAQDLEDVVHRFGDVTVIFAWSEDRLRIRFHPPGPFSDAHETYADSRVAAIRMERSWRWSRTLNCWQRKLTAGGTLSWSAVHSAEKALGVKIPQQVSA